MMLRKKMLINTKIKKREGIEMVSEPYRLEKDRAQLRTEWRKQIGRTAQIGENVKDPANLQKKGKRYV